MEPQNNRKCEVTASPEGGVGSNGTRDQQSITEVNSIQLPVTGELVRDWRSQAAEGEADLWSSPSVGKGGHERPGCGWRSNAGEVERTEHGKPCGGRLTNDLGRGSGQAAGKQSPRSSEETSNDRGAKGDRKADPQGTAKSEGESSTVPERDSPEEEAKWPSHGAEREVWSLRMLTALEKGVRGNRWHSLIDKVYGEKTLAKAWEKVKDNAGACGVDGISVERFSKDNQKRLLVVRERIKEGVYKPHAIKRSWIEKLGSAEKRPLGIPTVEDRVVQTALRMVIEPIFEREFAEQSYGFRPGRGCKDALRRVEELLKSGLTYVVDIDIRGYFDAIPHGKLMKKVGERISDTRVLGLIEGFLKAKVMEEGKSWEPVEGTPQGGVISPLLANIYLNELDWEMAGRGHEMVRYADDMVVLCRDQEEAERVMERIKAWMSQAQLSLHPEKTRMVDMGVGGNHFDFLGYRFWRGRKGNLRRFIRPKSKSKLREEIWPLTRRHNGKSMDEIITKLNRKLKGWYGYFKHLDAETLREVDGWIRGRLRTILRTREKKEGIARVREHVKWPNRYFAELGLFSLKQTKLEEIVDLRNGVTC